MTKSFDLEYQAKNQVPLFIDAMLANSTIACSLQNPFDIISKHYFVKYVLLSLTLRHKLVSCLYVR